MHGVTESDPDISRSRKRWDLDREALDALLDALGPDRREAGRNYEELRRRLADLFAWEGCETPDLLADEALNRVARKLAEGAEVPHLDRFAFGVARFLVQEDLRARRNKKAVLRELPHLSPQRPAEQTLAALEQCLAGLPETNRRLIERYYSGDRQALAAELGISMNALRNRAMRIREELSECVRRKRDNG